MRQSLRVAVSREKKWYPMILRVMRLYPRFFDFFIVVSSIRHRFFSLQVKNIEYDDFFFQVKVHSRTQDQHSLTPLLLAVQKGHAMMVRHLILAGASVHDRTPSQQTALQLAAEANLAEVCSILLSEGIDFSAMDSR